MGENYDIAVIGGGMAGASVAARLAARRSVILVEREDRPGYHATGRSAAAFEPNYGPASIRALSRAARTEFDEGNYLHPRATLFFAPEDQIAAFETLMAVQKGMREIPIAEARRLFPLLRDGYARRAVLDGGTADIDVDLLHQDCLRRFRAGGGTVRCGFAVQAMSREANHWRIVSSGGEIRAAAVVNAAGAWADHIAKMAGVRPAGLQPRRRSVAVIPAPEGLDIMSWPLVGDVGETWYAKPQSGRLLVSPADATPVDPHDAYADDMALAEGIDRFQQAADIEVTRVEHSWGGLRTFAPDGNPVCGYDPSTEGFFWLAGQGGYGIQTAPSLSRLAAALVLGEPAPGDIMAEGLEPADLAPRRFG